MREISFLENLVENLLEGGFIRALKPKLQPVQLAKALAKEMERSRMVGPETPLVANQYRIFLNPADLAQFFAFQANLERELASYLRGYASRRGYRPIAAITVSIMESSILPTSKVRTEGVMADASSPPAVPASPDWRQGTMEMAAVGLDVALEAPASLPIVGQTPAALLSESGELVPLNRPVISLGRAVDNDVVLDQKSVSRRHAQIRWDLGRYLLEDLGSTNGTTVSGERVTRRVLADGDEVIIGGVRFVFRIATL